MPRTFNRDHQNHCGLLLVALSLVFASCSSARSVKQGEKGTVITSLAPSTPFDSNSVDGILATVGDQAILLSDLQQAIYGMSNGHTQLLPDGRLVGGSLTPEQAQQILEGLINQKVLQLKASEMGMDVGEDELTQRIHEFLKQQGFSEEDLNAQLAKSGKTMADYRAQSRSEVLKQLLIGRVIAPLVTVTDDEVKSFYLQQTGSVQQVSAVKLRSLLISLPENAPSDPTDLPVIKTIQAEIAKGTPFVELVKKYSMAENASQNEGLLPPRPLSELPSLIRDKLARLRIDEVVGPFVVGNAIFFFQYLGTEFSAGSEFSKNMQTWRAKLQDIKFNERLVEYLKNERAKMKANVRPFRFTR